MNARTDHRSNGFTLIEILVALSISIVLLGGMVSVLLSSKQSYLRKETIGHMQENLRLASELIRKVLSMAEAVQQDSNGDRIIVTYSGGDGIVNCLGNPVSSGKAVSYFHVRKNALYCSSAYPVVPGSEQLLVNGITAMRVHYGVDSDDDGQVDRYTGSPGNWNTVIGARVILRLSDSTSQQQPEVTLTVAMRPRVFSRLKRGFQ